MCATLLLLLAVIAILFVEHSAADLPMMVFPGFSWAEQLAFDGVGNMWVSESVRGELWKINLNQDGTAYEGRVYLSKGIKQVGGLQISPDGTKLYAGVTLADKSFAIILVPLNEKEPSYSVVLKTAHQANGLACDWANEIMYYTDEGLSGSDGGTLRAVNLTTATEVIVRDHLNGADGAWFDEETRKLYVGELLSKRIMVFDTSSGVAALEGEYPGLSSLSKLGMLDDIAIFSKSVDGVASSTMLLGADWTGRSVQLFRVDGQNITTVAPPSGIQFYEPTSVRWGKGPGFDSNSIYVTEGGGVVGKETNRRVIQIKLK